MSPLRTFECLLWGRWKPPHLSTRSAVPAITWVFVIFSSWFVLTGNSLDYYKSYVKNSPKFGSIILNRWETGRFARLSPRNSIRSLNTYWKVSSMHLLQYEWCTRKTELALETKFYLDFHEVYMAMATNADQRKWRQIRISADQRKWRQIRISVVSFFWKRLWDTACEKCIQRTYLYV